MHVVLKKILRLKCIAKKKRKERNKEMKTNSIQNNNKSNFDKYVLSRNTKFSKLQKK